MKKFLHQFINLYPLWIISSSLLAFIYPPAFLWFSGQFMVMALSLVMLGMGLTLKIEDFKRILEVPWAIALGAVSQYTIMPFVGWGLAKLLDLEPDLAVGLILVASCPGGTASNVIAYLGRANVALSVVMTSVSTMLAIIVTPLLTSNLAGTYIPVDGWGIFKTTVQVVLVPVVLGVYLNYRFPEKVKKVSLAGPLVAVLAIVFISGSIVAQSADVVAEYAYRILMAMTLLHAFGFVLGYLASYLFGYSSDINKTVSIETGMQNGGLAAVLSKKNFAQNPMVGIPSVFSSVMQTLIGGLLAGYWRWRSEEGQ